MPGREPGRRGLGTTDPAQWLTPKITVQQPTLVSEIVARSFGFHSLPFDLGSLEGPTTSETLTVP